MNYSEERQRLNVLLERKFLSTEELEELQENYYVVGSEFLGISSDYPDYYWYDVRVCQEGSLPEDEDCLMDNYDIYEKRDVEDLEE